MAKRRTEIMEELKGVLGGKTLDALVPSVVFVVWGLNTASVLAIATGVAIGFLRSSGSRRSSMLSAVLWASRSLQVSPTSREAR